LPQLVAALPSSSSQLYTENNLYLLILSLDVWPIYSNRDYFKFFICFLFIIPATHPTSSIMAANNISQETTSSPAPSAAPIPLPTTRSQLVLSAIARLSPQEQHNLAACLAHSQRARRAVASGPTHAPQTPSTQAPLPNLSIPSQPPQAPERIWALNPNLAIPSLPKPPAVNVTVRSVSGAPQDERTLARTISAITSGLQFTPHISGREINIIIERGVRRKNPAEIETRQQAQASRKRKAESRESSPTASKRPCVEI
jgi:hypothetical protein